MTVTTTAPRRPRRPVWQPLAAAAVVLVVLAGAWLAIRLADSSPSEPGVTTGRDQIEVGVALVRIPDGMQLDRLEHFDPLLEPPPADEPGRVFEHPETSPATRNDGSVTESDEPVPTDPVVTSVRARLRTAVGVCTITSYRGRTGLRLFNHLENQRYQAELLHLAQTRVDLDARIAALDQQIAAAESSGLDRLASLVSRREAAVQSVEETYQRQYAITQIGPQRVSVGAGFAPTDAGRTTWRAQATPTEALQITCPDSATAQQLVDATTLPTATP
jgi:hypothetical protein